MDIILPKIWTEMPKDYSGDFVFALNRSLGRVYDVLSESATIFSHMKELTYEVGILAIQVYRILGVKETRNILVSEIQSKENELETNCGMGSRKEQIKWNGLPYIENDFYQMNSQGELSEFIQENSQSQVEQGHFPQVLFSRIKRNLDTPISKWRKSPLFRLDINWDKRQEKLSGRDKHVGKTSENFVMGYNVEDFVRRVRNIFGAHSPINAKTDMKNQVLRHCMEDGPFPFRLYSRMLVVALGQDLLDGLMRYNPESKVFTMGIPVWPPDVVSLHRFVLTKI